MAAQITFWTQNAPVCSCNPKERVAYICLESTCPNYGQRLYCLACMQESKHIHKVVTLPKFLQDARNNTDEMKEVADKLHRESSTKY